MKRYLTLLLMLLCAMGLPWAQAEPFDPWPQVRQELAELGITMDDAAFQESLTAYHEQLRWLREVGFGTEYYATKEYIAYYLLTDAGMGDFADETWEFTPSSSQVYALDAEVFNVAIMYTDFLRGVQAIVDDAVFDNVKEDISGINWNSMSGMTDGHRDVAFTCNGHPYAKRLDSYYDWLNTEIIDFVNDVLRQEGCRGQLHIISDDYDQIILLIYGDAERAAALRELIGTRPWEAEEPSLLDWLY